MMIFERLDGLIERFGECRIVVIGDFFLDKYLDTELLLVEHSVEIGQLVYQVTGICISVGVVGMVVNNLVVLGTGWLEAIGVVGVDGEVWELWWCLD